MEGLFDAALRLLPAAICGGGPPAMVHWRTREPRLSLEVSAMSDASAAPHIIVIAGPNGAGKSTSAPDLLRDTLHLVDYVNADAIAQGLSGFRPDRAATAAGRIAVERLHHLAARRESFAFESTLAGSGLAAFIARARTTGYVFNLTFLWLRDPDTAVARVADRVRRGGHDVPEATIRRRYSRGLTNFFKLYQPLADHWVFYDNSVPPLPRLVAVGRPKEVVAVHDSEVWETASAGRSRE
ncbi:MAG: AAA family ATPase [Candidatus Xenobia bacterium]